MAGARQATPDRGEWSGVSDVEVSDSPARNATGRETGPGLGRLLRRTSIDELPQLLNVLLGNMSLVGPRPALFNQYELTEMRLKRGVLRIPPGITGLAQVSGREDLSIDEKVDLDERYVRTLSAVTDLQIVVRTIGAVIGGRGNR
jgi:O-antigen biosynthesis protein WbqP